MDAVVFNRNGLDELLPTPRPNLNLVRQDQDPLYNTLGPEDGMLRFIVENYDDLPDVTVFLQAWPFQHCADTRGLITRAVLNAQRPHDVDFVSNGAQAGLVPIASTFLQYDIESGHVGHAQDLVRNDPSIWDEKIGAEAIGALAFNKTCRKVLQKRCNDTMWVAQGSQWAVTGKRIRSTTREVYEHVLTVSPGSGGRMKELALEALWPTLWGEPAWAPGLVPQWAPLAVGFQAMQFKAMAGALNQFCTFSTDGGLEKQCDEDAGFCLYSQSSGDARDAQALVELRPLLHGSAEIRGVCPGGYTFDDGSAPKKDQLDTGLKESVSQCAELCAETGGCRSFQWSAKSKRCRVHKAANPSAARSGDSVFCRSDSVPRSEVVESKPEQKVVAYLEGRISAPRAREQRAREAESDLVLRVEKAFGDTAKQLERRMLCSESSLSTPALAIAGKKWRLVDVGYPYFHIQVADLVNCLVEPAAAAKSKLLPCTSNKPTIKWELRKAPIAGFQLVSNGGKCLVRLKNGVSAAACEPDDSRQLFHLDMEKTGKFYEKVALEMLETAPGRLHVQCVTQLNSQAELLKPAGMQEGQIVRWRMTNASATHGEGAYFLSRKGVDGSESYLSCSDEKSKPEVILRPEGFAWFLREGKDGGVLIESRNGVLLQYDNKHGGLFCFAQNKDDTDTNHRYSFTLGISQTPAQPAQQMF